jgi:hypothetical protein
VQSPAFNYPHLVLVENLEGAYHQGTPGITATLKAFDDLPTVDRQTRVPAARVDPMADGNNRCRLR